MLSAKATFAHATYDGESSGCFFEIGTSITSRQTVRSSLLGAVFKPYRRYEETSPSTWRTHRTAFFMPATLTAAERRRTVRGLMGMFKQQVRTIMPGRRPVLALSVVLFGAGCAAPDTAFEIINYRTQGPPERLTESFPEGYYEVDPQGNVDIVLRTESPGPANDADPIVQVVHLQTFWRSIPGRTVADRTQLNGTVTYCVISPAVVASFEGVGSLFVTQRPRTDELVGALELARLTPGRVIAGRDPVFERMELSGTFRAVRDPRRVTATVNEIRRVFGSKE